MLDVPTNGPYTPFLLFCFSNFYSATSYTIPAEVLAENAVNEGLILSGASNNKNLLIIDVFPVPVFPYISIGKS
jgi:hypothetical protein